MIEPRQTKYKRPLDLVVLTAVHVSLFPIWATLWMVIPVLIWLEDRGPVFFVQERVGRDGRMFNFLKFRTMRTRGHHEEWGGSTLQDDPRVTVVGRFLRARSLDELPQIINLWKGEMTLVGPRPLPLDMHRQCVLKDPRFDLRVQVRPGLTGLAQVYGPRHCPPRLRLRYDLLYMRKASLPLDLQLLVRSVWLTLTGGWGSRHKKLEVH